MACGRTVSAGWSKLSLSIAVLLSLASCSHTARTHGEPIRASAACCATVERYPQWLIRAADPAAPVIGYTVGAVNWRRGYLSLYTAEQQDLAAQLRPLDILMTGHEGRLSNKLIPGLLTHALTYLGNETELRRLGVWDDPVVKPHQAAIRSGRTIIHSDSRGIRLIAPAEALDVDRVVVMRPACAATSRRKQVIRLFFEHLGDGFDFRFDSGDDRRLYCLELIAHAMPYLKLPTQTAYGRQLIVPDEVVTRVLPAGEPLQFVQYVHAGPRGFQKGGLTQLTAEIRRVWR